MSPNMCNIYMHLNIFILRHVKISALSCFSPMYWILCTLLNMPVHSIYSFGVTQHLVAQLSTSLTRKAHRWGVQIPPGQRFFMEEKDKSIYSKPLIFSDWLVKRPKSRWLRRTRRVHHSRQSWITKGNSSPSWAQHLSLLSCCYQ